MNVSMSLPHALLTSLLEKPCSGYELARRFDKSIGFFWHATHQQIYRELAKMEEAGWVSSVEVEGGRAGKKEFAVLDAGRAALLAWLHTPSEPLHLRDGLMVRLRASAVTGEAGMPEELQRRLALHEEQLAVYHAIEQRDFQGTLSKEARLQYLILKAGIAYEEGRISWTREAIAELQSAQD